MKVLRVIVDEMPKDCADCVFSEWRHRKQWWECDCFWNKNTTLQGLRPDWCPLVSFDTLTWLADSDKVLIEIECDPQ